MKYRVWVHHDDGDRYLLATIERLETLWNLIETIKVHDHGAYVSRLPDGDRDTFIPLAKIKLITWSSY